MYIYQVVLPPFMRNKMITLCPTTYETAQKMPNFSSWVRLKLMEYKMTGISNKEAIESGIKLVTAAAPLPKNYMCKHCLAIEDHWSIECPTLEVSE